MRRRRIATPSPHRFQRSGYFFLSLIRDRQTRELIYVEVLDRKHTHPSGSFLLSYLLQPDLITELSAGRGRDIPSAAKRRHS